MMERKRDRRLTTIVELLSGGDLVTANAMAAVFGVSSRTIYRDVHFLKDLRIQIVGEAGVGYVLRKRPDQHV